MRIRPLESTPCCQPLSGICPILSKPYIFVGLILSSIVFPSVARCQGSSSPLDPNSRPILGNTGNLRPPSQLPIIGNGDNAGVKQHRGPTGKPCLAVAGYAQAEVVNPKIFEHIIMASNSCSQPIKFQVCYYLSQHCVPADVPGYGQKEVTLGIMPALKDFRFEYREQF
jgi:hypothetical protein